MLELLPIVLSALGQSESAPHNGAVGLGSVSIPGSRSAVQKILDFARNGCGLETPLGRVTVESLTRVPGQVGTARVLITGRVNASDPWTYSPQIPDALVEFSRGKPAVFGAIQATGTLHWPEITLHQDGSAKVKFLSPLILSQAHPQRAGWLRRRFTQHLQVNLLGLHIGPTEGRPILSGLAHWIAPRLVWGV